MEVIILKDGLSLTLHLIIPVKVYYSYLLEISRLELIYCYLYLAALMDQGKFLLAARRYRNGAHIEYVISLDADDLSQRSKAYVGKLR